MLNVFKFSIKLILGLFITIIAILAIPIGAPMWLTAFFGTEKDHAGRGQNLVIAQEIAE